MEKLDVRCKTTVTNRKKINIPCIVGKITHPNN